MLRVLCGRTELEEYSEVVAIGDEVSRMAGRRSGAFFGTSLDEVEWSFDRYASLVGDAQAVISGTVTWIDAVYVRLTREPDGSWGPAPGSAWREPIATTATTWKPPEVIEWGSPSAPDGRSFRSGRVIREHDEHLNGWLITLEDVEIEVTERTTR